MVVPCANAQSAWARAGSPVATKNGSPAHSSSPPVSESLGNSDEVLSR